MRLPYPNLRLRTLMVFVALIAVGFGVSAGARRRWAGNRERAKWHESMRLNCLKEVSNFRAKHAYELHFEEARYAAAKNPNVRQIDDGNHTYPTVLTPEKRAQIIAEFEEFAADMIHWQKKVDEHARLAEEYRTRWW